MGSRVARIGDRFFGVCSEHDSPLPTEGVLVTGSEDVGTEGSSVCRIGDTGIGHCGHTTTIVSGSETVRVNGRALARIGDAVSGSIVGHIITASGTVSAE